MADHKVAGKHLRAALAAFCGVVLFGLGCETPAPMEIEEPDANVQQEEIVLTKSKFIYIHLQLQLGVPIDGPTHGVPVGGTPEKLSLGIRIPDFGKN